MTADNAPRCTGVKRDGTPCTAIALRDTNPSRCTHHRDQPADAPDTWTPDHMKAVAEAYAQLGNVSDAARVAGVSRANVYDWMNASDTFRQMMLDAREQAADRLERAAVERAVAGVQEPVYYRGEVVGHTRKYSDQILMFLLRAARPEKFRDRTTIRTEGAADQVPLHLQEQADALRAAGYDVRPADDAAAGAATVHVIGGSRDDYLAGLRQLSATVIDATAIDNDNDAEAS